MLLRCFIFFYLESLYQLSTQRVSSIGLLHVRPTALSRSIVWFRENYLASVAHTLKVLPFQSVISNSWMHQKAFRRLKGNMGPLLENREGIHFVKYCTPVSRYCIARLCVFVRGQFMKIRQNNKGILTLKSVTHTQLLKKISSMLISRQCPYKKWKDFLFSMRVFKEFQRD